MSADGFAMREPGEDDVEPEQSDNDDQGAEIIDLRKKRPRITKLSEVTPRAVEWLAYPYLPLGKLSMLSGDPSAGKSFISLAIAAGITRGASPLERRDPAPAREPANVILMLREDALDDTVRPRLDMLGADCDRVLSLDGWTREDDTKPLGERIRNGPVSMLDVDVIQQAVEAWKPALIVVDPLQSFMPPDVDLHRANETRPVLDAFADLARDAGCSVLLLRHLAKSAAPRAMYRGLGSIDLTAAVRSEMMAGEDPDGNKALVHVKSSLAPKGPAIGYDFHPVNGLVWDGVVERDAEDLVAPREAKKKLGGRPSKLPAAVQFLRDELAEGRLKRAVDIIERAREAGFSERLLSDARKEIGVQHRPVRVGESTISMWSLEAPPGEDEDAPG